MPLDNTVEKNMVGSSMVNIQVVLLVDNKVDSKQQEVVRGRLAYTERQVQFFQPEQAVEVLGRLVEDMVRLLSEESQEEVDNMV